MQSMPQYALVGSILASVVGALVMCVLVFRYGFTVPAPSDAEGGPTPTDVLITRVGHAVAGACFAATAVLAIVGLALRAPAPVAPLPTRMTADVAAPATAITALETASDAQVSRRSEEVQALETRLAEAEAQLANLDHEVKIRRATAHISERRVPSSSAAPVAAAPVMTPSPPPVSAPTTPAPQSVSSLAPPSTAVPVVTSAPPPALPVPTYTVPVTPELSAVTDEAPSAATGPSRAVTAATRAPATPQGKDLLGTARQQWDNARERASGFVDDVRAAYGRTERTLIQHFGKDPQGRVSARD